MIKRVHNPDVLTCIANLSSDEVFTPPSLVNQMLDTLPKELWSNEKATFLDPVSKSGVFLREITKRLIVGLKTKIPNLEDRIEHILYNQVFGIGITELTSLISRRSLYCSKYADGKYSIVQFSDKQGNLKYFETEHVWEGKVCKYCGVSKEIYDREKELESYAYSFIHSDNPNNFFNMKFDVIIGNPPYQMSSNDKGIQAKPLYNKFVEQSKKLSPRFLSMIIPSRWFTGGMGMGSFRDEMLNDDRIRVLVDYPKSRDCFPGVDIAGGVCYFLWERDNPGDCEVKSVTGNVELSRIRKLNEFEIFIRDNIGLDIIKKVLSKNEETMNNMVEPISPFGIPTSTRGLDNVFEDCITLVTSSGKSYIHKSVVKKNHDLIGNYKVSIGQLNPDRGGVNNSKDGKVNVFTKIKTYNPNTVFSATYLLLGSFKSKEESENFSNYMKTKFVRFIVFVTLSSMHITRDSFRFVPILNFKKTTSDEELFQKYNFSKDEILYIESIIRPME